MRRRCRRLDFKSGRLRTVYDFEGASVHVALTFTTPALPDDLDVLSRPLTYLTWDVRSADGRDHAVSAYFSDGADLAVNEPSQRVVWSRENQGILSSCASAPRNSRSSRRKATTSASIGGTSMRLPRRIRPAPSTPAPCACYAGVHRTGRLPADEPSKPRSASGEDMPVSAFTFDLGKVGAAPASRHLLLAYDDEYSIEYFGRKLRPYWRRNGATAADLLRLAEKDYTTLQNRCKAFDEDLTADLRKAGGEKYAAWRRLPIGSA